MFLLPLCLQVVTLRITKMLTECVLMKLGQPSDPVDLESCVAGCATSKSLTLAHFRPACYVCVNVTDVNLA